jgi:hypothetical protein
MSYCHVLIFFCAISAISKCDDLPDFYTFTVQDIEGDEVSLEDYRGSVSKDVPLIKSVFLNHKKKLITGVFSSQCG